jgi:hypothetical protein
MQASTAAATLPALTTRLQSARPGPFPEIPTSERLVYSHPRRRRSVVVGRSSAPWVDDERPPAPDGEAVWDARVGAWVELDALALEDVRPAPGVKPGAASRHRGAGRFVPWGILEARLDGVDQRHGRGGGRWLWDPSRSALETMEAVYQQTARAADIGRADLREPDWLRDESLGLNATELRLVTAVLTQYEAEWGGLYDCASTIAADLRIGSERTLRNLLWGQEWTTRKGERRRRPGLVERGWIRVVTTWRPGSRDGRPSDQHWNILRPGPALERAAAWHALAKGWTRRAPRGSGWGRARARRVRRVMGAGAARSRFATAGRAWASRRSDTDLQVVAASPVERDADALEDAPAVVELVAGVDLEAQPHCEPLASLDLDASLDSLDPPALDQGVDDPPALDLEGLGARPCVGADREHGEAAEQRVAEPGTRQPHGSTIRSMRDAVEPSPWSTTRPDLEARGRRSTLDATTRSKALAKLDGAVEAGALAVGSIPVVNLAGRSCRQPRRPGEPLRSPPGSSAQGGSRGGNAPPAEAAPRKIEPAPRVASPSVAPRRAEPRRRPRPAPVAPTSPTGGPVGPVAANVVEPRRLELAKTAVACREPAPPESGASLEAALAENALAGGFAASLPLRSRQALGLDLDVEACPTCDGHGRVRRPRVSLDPTCPRCNGRGER